MSNEKQVPAGEAICNSCGKTNLAGMRFCGFCGSPLKTAEAAAVAATKPIIPPPSLPSKNGVQAPVAKPSAIVPPPSASPRTVGTGETGFSMSTPREWERLISQATAFRVKGQITDARETLQKALALAEGVPPTTLAPLYEQIGDLLLVEELYDDALAAFEHARTLDPKRISADKKHAEAALQKAEATGKLSLSAAMLRGDGVADIIASGELGENRGKRNAGFAMLLSALMPGFGQLYNGQMVKGLIIIGVFALSLLVLSLSPEKDALFHDIAAIFAMRGGKASFAVSPLTSFFAILCLGSWLYSIVDAPFSASKTHENDSGAAPIDKSGWEV